MSHLPELKLSNASSSNSTGIDWYVKIFLLKKELILGFWVCHIKGIPTLFMIVKVMI